MRCALRSNWAIPKRGQKRRRNHHNCPSISATARTSHAENGCSPCRVVAIGRYAALGTRASSANPNSAYLSVEKRHRRFFQPRQAPRKAHRGSQTAAFVAVLASHSCDGAACRIYQRLPWSAGGVASPSRGRQSSSFPISIHDRLDLSHVLDAPSCDLFRAWLVLEHLDTHPASVVDLLQCGEDRLVTHVSHARP